MGVSEVTDLRFPSNQGDYWTMFMRTYWKDKHPDVNKQNVTRDLRDSKSPIYNLKGYIRLISPTKDRKTIPLNKGLTQDLVSSQM